MNFKEIEDIMIESLLNPHNRSMLPPGWTDMKEYNLGYHSNWRSLIRHFAYHIEQEMKNNECKCKSGPKPECHMLKKPIDNPIKLQKQCSLCEKKYKEGESFYFSEIFGSIFPKKIGFKESFTVLSVNLCEKCFKEIMPFFIKNGIINHNKEKNNVKS